MRSILHILTRPADDLTRDMIERQRALPDTKVEVAELMGEPPDYNAVLDQIFRADSVEVC